MGNDKVTLKLKHGFKDTLRWDTFATASCFSFLFLVFAHNIFYL